MNNSIEKLLRPHFRTIKGYVSAGMESDKTAEKIFLNANENPYPLPGLEHYSRYPEPQPAALLQAYAEVYGVAPDQICAARGADEAIALLTRLFCEPHKDAILITPPTFGIYAHDADAMPVDVIKVPFLEEGGKFVLDVDGILAAPRAKLIYLCSPNNPTGHNLPIEAMRRICRETEGESIVIVDEAYAEFSAQDSMVRYLGEHPNMIILRTLSKSYSLAGARMGCLISSDADFIKAARSKAIDTYPLPVGSIDAAIKALGMRDQVQKNIAKILAERERFCAALQAHESVTHIYPSDANFLLIKVERAKEFYQFCAERNILLRDFSAQNGTENCLRISVGSREENDAVLEALQQF